MKRFLRTKWKSETPLYHIWEGIKERCLNHKAKNYYFYGGRGISVCESWVNSFSEFEKWAVENGYKDGLTIDREDNDGDYCPENCKWVTQKEQARNRRTNLRITYNGETLCIAEWAERYYLPYHVLVYRVHQNWDFEKALTTPVRAYSRRSK